MRVATAFLLAAVTVCGSVRAAEAKDECKKYEPSVVTLEGTLVEKAYPGPPNYKSTQKGNRAETIYILKLRSPICTDEDEVQPDLNRKIQNVRWIQLELEPPAFQTYRKLVDIPVRVQGSLFGAHTAHHRTPVLMNVQTIVALEQR